MASQDARLSKFEADFKQQQSEMTNKIDTVLKAITDRITGTLPSDTVKNLKLGTHPVLSARSYPTMDLQCSSYPSTSINAIKAHFKEATISQTNLQQPVVEIEPQQPEEPEPTLEDEFQDFHLNLPVLEVLPHAPIYNAILDKYVGSLELGKNGSAFVLGELNIGLLEETDHIFGLADGTKSYPVGILKDVEVHIEKLKLLNEFYVIDMKKDPETPLLVGRGFLATANAVIDCRMAKIAVGEDITRESYKPRPSSDGIGVVRFINGTVNSTYKMPHKIEQYDSLSDLEKEHTKSAYLRNDEDKRRGVEYVMSKIIGFYKECLELGPEYLRRMDDEG
ncbi:MAK10-like protein [Tanacetum coccineum]